MAASKTREVLLDGGHRPGACLFFGGALELIHSAALRNLLTRMQRSLESHEANATAAAAGVSRLGVLAVARHHRLRVSRLDRLRGEELAVSTKADQNLTVAKRMLIAELEDADDRVLRRLTAAELVEILSLLEPE